MASNLYESIVNNNPNNINLMPRNTNKTKILFQLAQFKKMLGNRNPQDIVENMLKSGQMTKEQFDEYASIADNILGGG